MSASKKALSDYSSLVHFLYELGTLRKIPRSHMQTLMTSDLSDNIASHSFRVCLIGLFLARLEKADENKVLKMCLLHDTGESRSGDQNWVQKRYTKVFEDELIHDQLQHLPGSSDLLMLMQEYTERKTLEAKIAKDADRLDQTLLEQEYVLMGNLEAKSWGRTNRTNLLTDSAKKLSKLIIKTFPSDWWSKSLWTEKRR